MAAQEQLVKHPPVFPDPKKITWSKTKSGLEYVVGKHGAGTPASRGQTVTCHYCGWLENGSKFDSSYDRKDTFGFTLGEGMVIKGWDEGLELMCIGDVYFFRIPASLGYGARGAGPIPPNSTLIFQVELVNAEY